MSWKSIDIKCTECRHVWNDIVRKEEENNTFICVKCLGDSHKTISRVMILTASYPDGHRRSDGMGKALELDRLENTVADAKADGDFSRAEDAAKEWAHKKDEK